MNFRPSAQTSPPQSIALVQSDRTARLLACALLALGFYSATAFAQSQPQPASRTEPSSWDKTVEFHITAPPTKPNGKTWDGEMPVMFNILMPTLGDPAPDMMLCVVDTKGNDHCIHEASVNSFGVPFSICPNAYKCTFTHAKVPSTGYYGILIIDLDATPALQDYMLGAIIRNGVQQDASEAWKIEKALKSLIVKWHAVGAPDEFKEAESADCTDVNPCFDSTRGGIPGVAIVTPSVHACGMPIQGSIDFNLGDLPSSVRFQFNTTQNECPGTLEYRWEFGDGDKANSSVPYVVHRYTSVGVYPVKVIPSCVRKTSVCEAAPVSTSVSMGH